MKKLAMILAAACFALSAPVIALAGMDNMQGMDMGYTNHQPVVHQETVDGVKAVFRIGGAKEANKAMKMAMPLKKGDTDYISVTFKDAKTGKPITDGEVKVKVMAPDKSEQTEDLMAMLGEFGAFFNLSQKGKYGVMCKFKVKDAKVRTVKFWYTVK